MDIHPTARVDATALIDRTWPKGVHIGRDCHVAAEAVVLTHDFTRGLYLDTRIGARSYLGPRSIVLPGVTIGADCIVMPGALVNKDMGDHCIAIGNPAEIQSRHLCGTATERGRV
jgi:acetyltransferase-like isoleucine patch superfamily enzyme